MKAGLLMLACLSAAAPRLAAQSYARADTLVAAADTNGALAVYDALIRKNLRDTEAHYRAGLLRLTRFVPGTSLSEHRRKAEEHFRYASRFAPDSAKYVLALAELFRSEEYSTVRLQVAGLVDRAREAARTHGSAERARVEYRAGRIEWDRYESAGNAYMPIGTDVAGLPPIDATWSDIENFFENRVRRVEDAGEMNRTLAEEALRVALGTNPRYTDAAGLLIVALGEENRWPEAYEIARRHVRASPDSGRAHALLGLTLARLNRWRDAQATFTKALQVMTPAQREPYENLGSILRAVDSVGFANLAPGGRAALDSLYWRASQPLYLNEVNEVRVEFFARVTYVMHRWSDPLRGYQGYESDLGTVFIRWGRPDVWATGSGGTTWVYTPTRLRFSFTMQRGYARAYFGGDYRESFREARNIFPARFDNIPMVRGLDTIPVQIAQFRGDTGRATDVALFAETPIGRMVRTASLADIQLSTGAIVKDSLFNNVIFDRKDESVRAGDSTQVDLRSWRMALLPSQYLVRVEASLPAIERGARGSSILRVRPLDGGAFMMSDLLVAKRITPRDSTPERWTDFFIDPSSGRYRPGEPVGLLWEIYNLQPDSAGVAHYQVEVRFTVGEIERAGFGARVLGGIGDAVGLSARGDDRVTLAWSRDVRAPQSGRIVEYLAVDVLNAQQAGYTITVTIVDRQTGFVVTAERPITVTWSQLTK